MGERSRTILLALLALSACAARPPAPPVAGLPPPPPVVAPVPAPAPAPAPSSWITIRAPYAYDGDTLYAIAAGFPPELAEISIRVRGIDAPEIRGKCVSEKAAAIEVRDYVRALVAAGEIDVAEVEWDKYGGRVLATVLVDGRDLGELLIAHGLARPYDGGARQGWCG